MAGYSVIKEVCAALKKLLMEIEELKNDGQVVFKSPAEMGADSESGSTATLSLFLYRTDVNPHLRNMEPKMETSGKFRNTPLALDLLFMMTPYATDKELELLTLEKVMAKLHDNGVLKENMLSEELKARGNDNIRVIPNYVSLDDVNKLWGIFPEKGFKRSAFYIVTPVRIPSEIALDVSRVTDKTVNLYDKTRHA